MNILSEEVNEKQYLAYLELAKNTPLWNSKSEEYRKGVLIGIKAQIQ